MVLLFQPWLSASGGGGEIGSDAFGRLDGFTDGFDAWSTSKLREVSIAGGWGLLASAAMVTTVFAVVAHARLRTVALARLVMGSSAAVAILVLITLLYLDGKGAEMRLLIDQGDGFSAGLLRVFDTNGSIAPAPDGRRISSASLTPVALAVGVLTSGAAVAALAQGTRRYGISPLQALWRYVTPVPATPEPAAPAQQVADAEQPRVAEQPTATQSDQLLWDELVFDDDLVANVTWVRNPANPLEGDSSGHRSPALSR
ncbi:hypothetical protein OHA40_29820 [Nocardia sp. NBC_00508]|uniref:hypothetical protein n=1 Tax=Nocardia sp. NBC_00508 TaxID=2975992 RepID=UPI002E809A54|nr:hypothetical protein [Nocardia sp. NBC_00508]WUD65762.1 hypothetical protein OHA40_29820 [Nocardia sp. NBC_00508]